MIYVDEILALVFDRLLVMEERGHIKAGTKEERWFLQTESERMLYQILSANGLSSFEPKVEVKWDPIFGDPEEISLIIDPNTIEVCKRLGVWTRKR